MRFCMLAEGALRLRLLEHSEAGDLFSLIESNRDHLRKWLPWLDNQTGLEEVGEFIRFTHEDWQDNRSLHLGLWQDNQLSGMVAFHELDFANRRALLGYWLARQSQGRGVMTQAVRIMLRYGFTDLALHRVAIHCGANNLQSIGIARRLGFQREGVLREVEWLYDHFVDHEVYSLMVDEWKADSVLRPSL